MYFFLVQFPLELTFFSPTIAHHSPFIIKMLIVKNEGHQISPLNKSIFIKIPLKFTAYKIYEASKIRNTRTRQKYHSQW